jgi:Zn-dependent membrane protease YugP
MTIRNAAVPVANLGSNAAYIIFFVGFMFHLTTLVYVGIALFCGVVFFQVVNLPVEFNASTRAKQQLVGLNIINQQQLVEVNRVLNAAALTYVAGTLQAVMTLVYFLLRASGGSRD